MQNYAKLLKLNEFDEQMRYLDLLHNHLYISNYQIIKDFDVKFTNLLNKIILTGRNSSILLFSNQYFIEDKDFSSRIENSKFQQFQEIISYLIPEETEYTFLKKHNYNFSETNKFQQILRTALSTLKIFGLGIHHYFLPQRENSFKSEYFGTIIFPSIFSYFTFNEMIESSYRLLMATMIQATYEFQNGINDTHFFNGSLNSVEGIMFSSFFNGFPHFISSFCHFFINLVNQNVSSFHLGSLLEFICQSLQFSSQYLTSYHIKILKYVKQYRKIEFFLNFFMIRVLQNNLCLYLESDFEMKCKCSLSKKAIIEQFELVTKKLDPIHHEKIYVTFIQKIIGCKTFSFPFQSLDKNLNKQCCLTYLSRFDLKMIHSILQSSYYRFNKALNLSISENPSFDPQLIILMTHYYQSQANCFFDREIERNLNKQEELIKTKYDMNENAIIEIDSKSRYILSDIKSQLNKRKIDKNSIFNVFKENDSNELMKVLIKSKYENVKERYISSYKENLINEYEKKAEMIENYIDNRLNLSHLELIYLSFKQRQEIFLSFISSVITNSLTFSQGQINDFICPEQYIFNFNYKINNTKSALMNPYFELTSYKEVHLSPEFDVLMHQNQLLQKFKEFFDSEIENADLYIKNFMFEGRRKDVVDELITTLSNVYKVSISDRLLVISNVISSIFQIVESLQNNLTNSAENIFLNVYLKSNSVVILPTFVIYSFLFNHNKLFNDVMNDFNPKIKNAIDLLDNAIVNVFLVKKSDLQSLIRNFISVPNFT